MHMVYPFSLSSEEKMLSKLSAWTKSKIETLCKTLEKNILSNKYLKCNVVYGPVRSRRLELVLGVNNVKSNVCSYNCIYCPIRKYPVTEEAVKTFAYSNGKMNKLDQMISQNLIDEFVFKNKKYFKLAETK